MGVRKKLASWLAAAFTFACAFALMSGSVAFAAESNVDLGEPLHTKTLTANDDGTYNLTLDVTGKSQAASEKTKANVIVVFDVSGSMGNSEGKSTRLAVAKNAVNDLVDQLMAQNTAENPDTVQMALVTFSDSASVKQFNRANWTTSASSFKSVVNGLSDGGGTNWEDALATANGISGDDDPTYVIFVSDGNPTRYINSRGNVAGSGQETDSNVATCYDEAKDDARAIVAAGKSFYAIGAFGDVDRMQDLVNYAYSNDATAAEGKYYAVSDGDALNAAFAAIISDIQKNFTYTDVSITDKVTDLTATTAGIDGEVTDFVYKKNGEVWEDAPKASFSNGTVTWNLGDDFRLENGVTYSVSFKVWPNQKAFDTVAALTNGTLEYDAAKYPNIVKNQDGTYSVYTNESAVLSYKQVDTVDGKETVGEEKTAQYERPLMPVPVSVLNIQKVWENAPANFTKPAIEVVVTQDGQDYQTVVLNAANKWNKDIVVAAGPTGHTYGVEEITDLGNGWTTSYGQDVKMQGLEALSAGFGLALTNTYKAAPVTLEGDAAISVQKILVGRDWKDSDEFQFELSAVTEGAPMPQNTTVTAKNDTPIAFGDIEFTQAGTYEYQVIETKGSIPGVSYDQTVRTVVVTVVDNGKGQLEATVDYGTPEAEAAVFTNYYGAEAVKLALQASKIFEGRDWTSSDEFEFVLKGSPASENGTVVADEGNQTVSFGDITFDKVGTYEFTITETAGDIPGVTYDDEVFTVLVEVADDTEGSLYVANLVYKTSDGKALSGASFKNTYKAEPVVVGGQTALKASKELTGREWTANDVFTAELAAVDGAPMPKDAVVELTADKKTAAFGDIEFTKAGTYNYTITETAGDLGGVTYDETVYEVTVTVTDDGKGKLVAEVSYGNADAAVFTNTYEADEVTLEGKTALKVQKVLEGRDWMKGDEFTFSISSDSDGAPLPADKKITVTDGNVADFGAITFTEAGVYTYTITEDKGILGGILYDEAERVVTVVVTDDGKGQLHASVDYGEGAEAAVFTNVYGADEVTLQGETALAVAKELVGRDWTEGDEFEFVLAAVTEDAPMPENATVTATGSDAVSFGAMTFTEEGTYEYTLTEAAGTIGGITYDDTLYTVVVEVEDDKQGDLVATVTYNGQAVDAAVFTNKYAADEVVLQGETALKAAKVLEGRDWQDGDSFQFKLTAVTENAPMPAEDTVAATSADAVSFGAIAFDKAGTYEYTLSEVAGSIGGITYDDTVYEVTVVVTDNGKGKLEAEVSYGNASAAVFTNVYAPEGDAQVATADFGLTKELTGRDWAEGESFEFQIEALTEGAPMPESTTAVVSENGGVVDFGSITYNASELPELPATFEYKITEVAGSAGGVNYDSHEVVVKVVVTDQLDGTIRAAATVIGDKTFNNVYDVTPAVLPFTIQKTLDGHDMAEGQFEFTVEPQDDASAEKLAAATVKNGAAADGATDVMTLGNLTFKLADAGKTFTYEVAEVQADAAGYTYDNMRHTVEFVVADGGKGTLDVTVLVDDEEAQAATVAFTNTYRASGDLGADGSVGIVANKTLEGQALSAGEFSFSVKDAQGNQVATGTNAADGSIAFSAIEYTTESVKADVEAGLAVKNADGTYTYTYQVVEDTEGLADKGITPTASNFGVTVTLTDDGKGNLIPEVTYPEGADSLEFVNQYGTNDAQLVIAGAKVLSAAEGLNPPDITGKFTFTLTGQNADGLTATNDAAGNVTFDAITYTAADLEGVEADENNVRTAVFEYTVTESGIVDGIINDGKKTFTVTVTDDGQGHLTATPDGNAQFVFTNIYTVLPEEAPVTPSFSFLKVLDGRQMVDGEFQFQMTDANGQVVSTGTNRADGTVVMDPITFTQPGTYVYSVSEVQGELGGITYDPTVFTMTATVADNSNGTLTVSWGVDSNEGIVFRNSYAAESTVIQFGALKLMEGRDLVEGEFTFELVNEGDVLSTATNAADGSINFEEIEFPEEGTYLLEIREVQGNAEGVTYDDFVCQIEVVVTDDLNGALQPEVTFLNGDPIFTNFYEEPVVPSDDGAEGEEPKADDGEPTFAQTNDATPFGFVVALAAAAVAVLATLRKRLA